VQALNACGVTNFFSVNVLEIRTSARASRNTPTGPTIPQLYVKGRVRRRSDIVKEMYQSGELQEASGRLKQKA